MATKVYNVDQFRSTQVGANNYLNNMGFSMSTVTTQGGIKNFTDVCLNVSGNLVPEESYYIKFMVYQKTDFDQYFDIILKNKTTGDTSITQRVKTYKTIAGKSNNKIAYEFVFTPNSTYNQIVFRLQRIDFDYSLSREMNIEVVELCRVTNIVDTSLKVKHPELVYLKKIGVQGPTGMMFVLNGEEIKIGRTGIYELYSDLIQITFLGFILKNDKTFFTVDYQY